MTARWLRLGAAALTAAVPRGGAARRPPPTPVLRERGERPPRITSPLFFGIVGLVIGLPLAVYGPQPVSVVGWIVAAAGGIAVQIGVVALGVQLALRHQYFFELEQAEE